MKDNNSSFFTQSLQIRGGGDGLIELKGKVNKLTVTEEVFALPDKEPTLEEGTSEG